MDELRSFEFHLHKLEDSLRSIEVTRDVLEIKDMSQRLRVLIADGKPKRRLFQRLLARYELDTSVEVNHNSPHPIQRLTLDEWVDYMLFSIGYDEYTVGHLIRRIAESEGLGHESSHVRSTLVAARTININGGRIDVQYIVDIAAHVLVMGFFFLRRLREIGIYTCSKGFDLSRVEHYRRRRWQAEVAIITPKIGQA